METYEQYDPDTYKYIVSIDIGVQHLALSLLSVLQNFKIHEVVWFDLIDITQFVHLDHESKKVCQLFHDKTFTDYLEHVFYLHNNLFSICDYVLIERQPPQGYVVVEQLIFSKYRKKAILVSPNSIHSAFGWKKQNLDYDARKDKSIEMACKYIVRDYMIEEFENYERQHDISDSICIAVYWCHKKYLEYTKQKRMQKIENQIRDKPIESFRFIV